MVERRGRDISGKWIYLCYPCAAVCSGENILQLHISGKKHKTKLAQRNTWPTTIFEEHPFNQTRHGSSDIVSEQDVKKIAMEVEAHKAMDTETMFKQYEEARCHIQDALDAVKAPLVGVEYLIEHPPEEEHHEPSYLCTLCSKQGHPRTIINHMTCFWHKNNYLARHFPRAAERLTPFRSSSQYREGVNLIMNRLAQRVEDTYGRLRPVHIDKEEYDRNKNRINEWMFKKRHFSEKDGCSFVEVVDIDLMDSLHQSNADPKGPASRSKRRDPSPPVVAAPKSQFNHYSRPAGRQERRAGSGASLSDISDEAEPRLERREKPEPRKARYEPYPDRRRDNSPFRSRFSLRNPPPSTPDKTADKKRAPNYEYKIKLASERRAVAEEQAKKALAYHEKNPEKHPLYPEEWKKFWNRRYKEIQAEGKDPSKHDFKPEWIIFWTKRMKELHDEELRVTVVELYRKLSLSPPDFTTSLTERKKSPEKRRSPERPRSEHRRRSPEPRHRPGDLRRRSPDVRRRSPDLRRRSPGRGDSRRALDTRQHSPPRRRSPEREKDLRPSGRRSPPNYRRSPARRPDRRHSPTRSNVRSRSPVHRRSPSRTHISLEAAGSRSPLSQREVARNRSPERRSPALAPSLQTVLVSDDELKVEDSNVSPWNSDNEIDSVTSSSCGAPDDVVATLRLLVALEDYLGSLGPKIVDLLAQALKMEKDKPNSSEELLVRESAVVLMETAKEKLKGAAQAGLVPPGAAPAVRAAVVRAAATLHEADKRQRKQQQKVSAETKPAAVPVAGVGEVDRAQIAQQMAEALIAQGKTDVSSEELAQLVDAVVGIAEAKNRETAAKKALAASPAVSSVKSAPLRTGGSALQMLQSAYDENDKKTDREDIADAMDGLSDSDLETLLKNFNELSAEEQHSLIAYLKKMEAKEPARVEKLRKYVTDAASTLPLQESAPPPAPRAAPPAPAPAPPAPSELRAVLIESDDDDDYTVDEVFQSATQKVREDQMRQEMEIVKKSLEENKPPLLETPKMKPLLDFSTNFSSASDLLALVQASLKSTGANSVPPVQSLDVVASNTQPRSFGDLPEIATSSSEPINSQAIPPLSSLLTFNNSNQTQGPFNNSNPPPQERPPYNQPQQNYQQQSYQQQDSYEQQPPYQQDQQSYQQDQQPYQQQQQPHHQQQQPHRQQQQNHQQQQQNHQQQQPPFHQKQLPYQQQQQPPYQQQNSYNDNRNKPMHDQRNAPQQPWGNRPNLTDNRGPPMSGGSGNDNFVPNMPFNQQGPRNNFNNNFNRQQYGNQNQNNFRGRGGGGGRGFGVQRGRGRGYY